MQTSNLNVRDIPLHDLLELGLYKYGEIALPQKDIDALVSGMRTGLVNLANISYGGIEVKEMNVKLSLTKNAAGNTELLIHPVYKKPLVPEIISASEAEDLFTGARANLIKETSENGRYKRMMVEYDPDTQEYIVTDTSRLRIPETVNGMPLTPYQKERYGNGRQIEMPDDTSFQASSTTPEGLRSNRLSLVVSLLMDGGISYIVCTGLQPMVREYGFQSQRDERNENYQRALKLANDSQAKAQPENEESTSLSNKNEYSRGYGRSGLSR